MKDFTYTKQYGLRASDCEWLSDMGLRETRWFLDIEWLFSVDGRKMPYNEWIRRKNK